MTRDEVQRFIDRRNRAWFDRDADALAADHSETCTVESPTHGELRGRTAIREIYATWFDAFPDLRFNHDELVLEGDRVALFFTASGTHMKPFGTVPASKRPMTIRGVFLWTFVDGVIVHEKRYYDSMSLLMQIGVLKAKPM
jgi:steroid delta-isomerase-like uncharacterized protein